MTEPDPRPRPRGVRAVVGIVAGVLLTFGGMCGVGPTDLSLLAVSARHQVASPDDARGQVTVPATAEEAQTTRRVVRRGAARLRRARRPLGRALRRGRLPVGLRRRLAPPLRGPPALVA